MINKFFQLLSILLVIHSLLIHSLLFSQTMNGGSTETNWRMVGVSNNNTFESNQRFYNRQGDILYLSNKEAVFPVVFDNKEGYGVVKLNDKSKEVWKQNIEGDIMGISKLEGNILVLYTKEKQNKNDKANILSAVILDPVKGKVVKQKVILNIDGSNFADVTLFKFKNGDFQKLSIRYTSWSGKRTITMNKNEKEARLTTKIDLYTITKNLDVPLSNSYTIQNSELQFLNAAFSSTGELLVLWATNTELILEKFHEKNSVAKLSTPFEWKEKWLPTSYISLNEENEEQVLCTVAYLHPKDVAHKIVLFNIAGNNVKATDEFLNGKYQDQLEEIMDVPQGSKKKIEKKVINDMQVVGLFFYDNIPVVIKEIRGSLVAATPNSHTRFINGDAFVCIYDNNLNAKKQFFINKDFTTFIGLVSQSFGYRLKENTLQFITNQNSGTFSYATVYGEINLKEMKWDKISKVNDEGSKVKSRKPIEPAATLWFPKSLLISYLTKGLFEKFIATEMQLVNYE